jgi:next-to-BRCA1 protein 1
MLQDYQPTVHHMSTDTLTCQGVAPVSPVIARSPNTKQCEVIIPASPPKTVDADGEAPVPQAFTARQSKYQLQVSHNNR